ncbi:MAG: exo-alpha-sialidase [Nitrolancea sp.]
MKLARAIAILAALLLITAACGGSNGTLNPTPFATPGSALNPTPGAPAVSPSASPAEGTPVSGESGDLGIDGEHAITVAVPDPNKTVAYAATQDALYRPQDTGGWDQIGRWDPSRSLLVDPTNTNVLYSGGHPGCAVGGPAIGLQKSIDGGNTWSTLLTGQNVRPMIVDPANPQVIYGERCSLAISVNGGQTWNDYAMTPSFDVSDMSLVGNTLYVLITSEGGTSRIRPIDVSDPSQPNMGDDLHEFWGGGTLIASSDRIVVAEPHGVDVSTDSGKTWTFSRAGLESVTVSVNALAQPIPKDELSGKFGIYALAVDPSDVSHILAGTIRGLYESHDGAKTWNRVMQIEDVQIDHLAFAQGGALLYVTTDNGVIVLQNS